VRVVTLNLWGRFGDWPSRRAVLIDGLRALRPDLVTFQEAIVVDGYDQVVDLLGDGYRVAHQTGREDDGSGASIASRWPLTGLRELDLNVTPRTAGFACGTLVAEIRAPEPVGALVFVNHKPNFESKLAYEREQQAVLAGRFLEELAADGDRHVVVAGDQDATPEAASIRFWTGEQSLDETSVCYRDAWRVMHPGEPGATFMPGHNPLVGPAWPRDLCRRIDYVFVRCDTHGPTLAVTECRRIFDEPVDGVWASDHFGVLADLEVPSTIHSADAG
jgi:endonuclease/exonuclease/phosphatase family metal-dependent hydrolase